MNRDGASIEKLRAVLRRFERVSQEHLRSCCRQVTLAQCHVLLAIDADGQSTATRLARQLELDISTVSRTVDGLVTRGLLFRQSPPEDRRQTLLSLTDKGQQVCTEINRDADRFFANVLTRLPAKRRSIIIRDLEVLVDALAQSQERESACSNDAKCESTECEP